MILSMNTVVLFLAPHFTPGGCGKHWARGSAYLLLCSDDLSLPGRLQCSLSLVSPPASDGWEVPLRRPLWTCLPMWGCEERRGKSTVHVSCRHARQKRPHRKLVPGFRVQSRLVRRDFRPEDRLSYLFAGRCSSYSLRVCVVLRPEEPLRVRVCQT